ncbi:NRDE family protein, partial [Oxalobacteraceae bacterium OM1]
MCLIVFAWHVVPGNALFAAANRDEFYARPAKAAHWWEDHPEVYAGRDLEGGGTWLGVTKHGRFAALTNVRNPAEKRPSAPTRGALVADYLTGAMSPESYVAAIAPHAAAYNGFN